jgi:serine/threonine protein kinase
VARLFTPDNYRDTSGTPGYMAPEVINRENHSFEVDYFALGVIAYECMLGKVPLPHPAALSRLQQAGDP